MPLGGLLEEFLDQQVIQESQVNVVHPAQEDLQEGRDLVFLGLKGSKVTLAIQDSKVWKDCSDTTLLRQHHKIDWNYSMELLLTNIFPVPPMCRLSRLTWTPRSHSWRTKRTKR